MKTGCLGRVRRKLFHHDEFYDALRALGAPTHSDMDSLDAGQYPSPEGRRSLLAEKIECVQWDLTFGHSAAADSSVARLGLIVDSDIGREQAEARRQRWHKVQTAIFFSVVPWVVLLMAGEFWLSVSTAFILGVTFIAGEAIAKSETHYLVTLDILERWLGDDERIVESVPLSWEAASCDAEARTLVIEWMRTTAESKALEDLVAEGVWLHKSLSLGDPRRETMKAEIDTRRARLNTLTDLRSELTSRVTSTVEAVAEERDRVRREKIAAADREAAAQSEARKLQEQLKRVSEQQSAHVKRHEAIDEWFDKNTFD